MQGKCAFGPDGLECGKEASHVLSAPTINKFELLCSVHAEQVRENINMMLAFTKRLFGAVDGEVEVRLPIYVLTFEQYLLRNLVGQEG